MDRVVLEAPAKINVVLRVTGVRADGYHELLMLNEKLTLADEISIETRDQRLETRDQGITITCDDPDVPCNETNLCYRAASVVFEEVGKSAGRQVVRSVNIDIKKRIPVAAGLGGGSSDAAAVMMGLSKISDLNWSREKLADLSLKIGTDLPFFFFDGPAVVEGVGEKVRPVEKLPNMPIILINPGFEVSTPEIYKTFDRIKELQLTHINQDVSSLPPSAGVLAGRNFKGLADVAEVIHNDLEFVTAEKYPEIVEIENLLKESGALVSWMSGSGPTVIGLFESIEERDAAFENLNEAKWRVFLTSN